MIKLNDCWHVALAVLGVQTMTALPVAGASDLTRVFTNTLVGSSNAIILVESGLPC